MFHAEDRSDLLPRQARESLGRDSRTIFAEREAVSSGVRRRRRRRTGEINEENGTAKTFHRWQFFGNRWQRIDGGNLSSEIVISRRERGGMPRTRSRSSEYSVLLVLGTKGQCFSLNFTFFQFSFKIYLDVQTIALLNFRIY